MEKLPSDIIENILFRLPAEAASEAKRVCTTWETLLSNYISDKQGYLFFIKKFWLDGHEYNHLFYGDEYEHYDHAKMNYYHSIETLARMEPHRFNIDGMVGSCNGLVCFRRNKEDGSLDSLQICNPLTGEYVILPNLSSSYAELFARNTATDDSIGFGYCCSTKKYKVVRIYNQKGHVNGHVQVYTVGEKWRDIGFVTFVSGCALQSLPGTYSCGALHWCHSNFSEIWAFDLEHEIFYYIPLPEDDGDNPHTVELLDNPHSVRNNFCIVYLRTSCIDIWGHERDSTSSDTDESNLKQNYNDIRSWSWIMKFSIEYLGPDLFTPFAITRNEQLLLWYKHKILYCYDPETSTLNKLWKNKILCCSRVEAIPHVHIIWNSK